MVPADYNDETTEDATHQSTTIQSRPDSRTVELRLDPTDFIDEIKHTLEGKVFDEDADAWVYPDGIKEPLIQTKRGINDVMRIIGAFVNKNTILSEFTENEINLRLLAINDHIVDHLAVNSREFFNSDPDTAETIRIMILSVIDASLRRALGRGESRAISESQIVERSELGRGGRSSWLPFGR